MHCTEFYVVSKMLTYCNPKKLRTIYWKTEQRQRVDPTLLSFVTKCRCEINLLPERLQKIPVGS